MIRMVLNVRGEEVEEEGGGGWQWQVASGEGIAKYLGVR